VAEEDAEEPCPHRKLDPKTKKCKKWCARNAEGEEMR
jgi:hypothetical protein